MKKFLLLLLTIVSLSSVKATTGDIRVVSVNSDTTYSEIPVTFVANGILSFGSSPGTVTTVSLANYATTASLSSYATVSSLSSYVTTSSLTSTLSGYATLASLPTVRAAPVTVTAALTKAVTFSSPVPSANYELIVITNGLVTSGYATAKTTSGFTLNLPIAITGTVGYVAIGDQ